MAIDAAGRIHVSDCGNGRVVVLAAINSTSPPPGTALLSIYDIQSELSFGDYDLVLDGEGNVYIPDTYNNRLVVLTGYGSAVPGTELFSFNDSRVINQPDGVSLDAAGNIYIGNTGDYSVIVLSGIHSAVPGTQLGHFIPSGTNLPFLFPQGVQLDAAGNVYVQDNGNNRVAVLAPLNSITPPPGTLIHSFTDSTQALARGRNLALDTAGNMYIICVPRLVVLASITSTTSTPGTQLASFNSAVFPLTFPTGIAVDRAGNMYVADASLHRLTVLASLTTTVSGGPGTILLTLNVSAGCVSLDSQGNMYAGVTDSNGGRVLVYASLTSTTHPPGSLLYTFLDNSTTTQSLTSPYGIAFDALDNIYLTDSYTYRVVILSSITSAHPGVELYSLYDSQEGLNQIVGIAVDPLNRIFIVDGGNQGVRVLAGIPMAAVSGDPQFRGFRGQSYQVHGLDGGVYSIISSASLQLNALFTFLSAGACPVYPSTVSTAPENCWSHPGSYFGSLGLRTSKGDRLRIDAGAGGWGFHDVTLNGQSVLHREGLVLGVQLNVTMIDSHHLSIAHGTFSFSVDNSDGFVNLASITLHSSWSALTTRVQPHGLLGQSWMTHRGSDRGMEVAEVQGVVDDYLDVDGDLFGHHNVYDRFIPDSE